MTRPIIPLLAAVLVTIAVAGSSVFILDQRHEALLTQFGQVRQVVLTPGLHAKVPFAEKVVLVDRRVETVDQTVPDRYITSDKKPVLLNVLLKWAVSDPRQFFASVHGQPALAEDHLMQSVRSALNDEIAQTTLQALLGPGQEALRARVTEKLAAPSTAMGVKTMSLEFRRIDLTASFSDDTYRRMEAEQQQRASQLRSEGEAEAEQVKADADRQREVLLAQANERAQMIKGEGDAKASQVYAEAFSRDPQFYEFYKSLKAYEASFASRKDVLVLDTSSEFFKFFRSPSGMLGAGKAGR